MITNTDERIEQYFGKCRTIGMLPTKEGLAKELQTTAKTLKHVCTGYYNSTRPYTNNTHVSRCIGNDDFELIKTACKRIEQSKIG